MAGAVLTRSYNRARTGSTDQEATLSATAVRTRGVAKLFSMQILDDPRLEAQPLAVPGVHMADGRVHDIILQASMGNCVYAFDAGSGAELWRAHLGRPITGTKQIDAFLINVSWGILSTPVIDEGAGLIYACAWISEDGTADKGQHFLAALRLSDGTLARPLLNLEGAVYAPPGLPQQKFASAQRKQRAALMILHNHVLIPFGTIRESGATARGWLIAVNVNAWRIAATWCSTVTGSGGGLWHSGGGPALGSDGAIYVITGNGAFGPQHGDYSESIVKLTFDTGDHPAFKVAGWWTPWTDTGRSGGNADGGEDDMAMPSNVVKTRLVGHAKRLGMLPAGTPHLDTDHVTTGAHPDDQNLRAVLAHHVEAMAGGAWADQDFGAGGPVFVESAGVVLAAGKDGILYTANCENLGDTKAGDLAPAASAANYAKLKMPPILYTYFDPGMQPAPPSAAVLNKLPGGATRHLHGTSCVWISSVHGVMHFVGGENSALRAWSIDNNGHSTYLAGSDEIASEQAPRPPGGMPGWSLAVAGNSGKDGIVAAMMPYNDSNMALSPGRFLIYDAQNFATNPDGSRRLQVIWDSAAWGYDHAFTHPKFNRPIVWNGRIYRPTYDGRIDVYGLPP